MTAADHSKLTSVTPTNGKSPQPLHVALACDQHYVTQLVVTATSIARHAQSAGELCFHVIYTGLDEAARARVERCVRRIRLNARFDWVLAPDGIDSVFGVVHSSQHVHLTPATLYRLLIDDLLDRRMDRVVYVDVDTVVQADLGHFLTALADDTPIAGVHDFVYPLMRDRFPSAEQHRELSITGGGPYLNAGVLAINRSLWRSNRLGEVALSRLVQSPELMLSKDQDALNAALDGRGTVVDARWNVQLGMLGRRKPHLTKKVMDVTGGLTEERLIDEARVLHFTGPKPWIRGINAPARHVWWRALHESGWLSELVFRSSQARWWGRQIIRHLPRRQPVCD